MYHKDQPTTVGSSKPPNSPKNNTSLLIAEKIGLELEARMEEGSLDLTEAAGLNALKSLLIKSAGGLLTSAQEFTLLKSLADKKTPDPVQKIEQQTKVDFNVTITEAIKANAPALQSSLEKAEAYNQEILAKLAGNLMLDGDTKEEVAAKPTEEPYELTDLRTGGDGSVKIQSFRDRIQGGFVSQQGD